MAEGFDWRSALISTAVGIVAILVAIFLAWRSSDKSFREFVCGWRRSSPGTNPRAAPDLEQQAGHEAMPLNRLPTSPLCRSSPLRRSARIAALTPPRRSSRLAARSHSSPR
ncbi:hypothetical protein N7536_004065 [Penicillium majusculum]|nr:hypothetical protein N7536_004065 [Penicillium majusculum]